MFSDRRLKTDIERLGELDGGPGIYKFRYIGLPGTRVGLMADDVERFDPGAVVVGPGGFKMVDYKRAAGF
jgi:hypothetical protein